MLFPVIIFGTILLTEVQMRAANDNDGVSMEELVHSEVPCLPDSQDRTEGAGEGKVGLRSDFVSSPSDGSELINAMEREVGNSAQLGKKAKRDVCDQIMNEIRDIPCDDTPVVINCGGQQYYQCGPTPAAAESSLRAALPDEIIAAPGEAVSQGIGPVQTLPVAYPPMSSDYVPVRNLAAELVSAVRNPRILTESERRERQKGIFEGLLRFGTVVNHIDSYLTDKGKILIKGLHKMVESEEDPRFA